MGGNPVKKELAKPSAGSSKCPSHDYLYTNWKERAAVLDFKRFVKAQNG
ncbi:hypothetical protein [Bacillus sp. FJAT-29814]|nr:hypothetical protein [Bacillus sp. FJAT-29814]